MADALVSGTSESNFMRVQVPSSAPNKDQSNRTGLLFWCSSIRFASSIFLESDIATQ